MARSVEDYRQLLASLLPQGLIWPKDAESNLGKLLAALAEELARVDRRAGDVINESDPRTTFELLAEWEAACGLPEECDYSGSTLAERRAALTAKYTSKGGQRPQDYIDMAAALGYEVTLIEHRPARAGVLRAGEPCSGEAWAHCWQINAPETTVFPARAGACQAGDRLRTWGNEKLECTMQTKKPAQTIALIAYGA
jgi:uncharacterized protein YmfQ (DUF2313 family)